MCEGFILGYRISIPVGGFLLELVVRIIYNIVYSLLAAVLSSDGSFIQAFHNAIKCFHNITLSIRVQVLYHC